MSKRMNRRKFLKSVGTGAAALIAAACAPSAPPTALPPPAPAQTAAPPPAPTAAPKPSAPAPTAAPAAQPTAAAKAAVQGDRVVVAVGAWGTETPFSWKLTQTEKPLWGSLYEQLLSVDAKTFQPAPGLATEWGPSNGNKTWTFKLRQGVKFHGDWGEFTSDDVKFTVEQNLKPDATSVDAQVFRTQVDKIETPDKYTFVIHFKSPLWEVPEYFSQVAGYQVITSKKYIESVGVDKAALHPIGTGPYEYVEGRQGDFHRFKAVDKHWRVTPAFKELVIRRIPDPATRMAGLRSGEIDIVPVSGDYYDQAKKAGLKIHEMPNAVQYWVVLSGQTSPGIPDYNPKLPWIGDSSDPKSAENARKVRLALNLAVNKQAIVDGLWKGTGSTSPFSYWYYPFHKGFDQSWTVPPYDRQKAKQLLAEAGYPDGFDVTVNPMIYAFSPDGPDVMEAVALDWEKIGLKVKRVPEDTGSFTPKFRAGKTDNRFWVASQPPLAASGPSIIWKRVLRSDMSFHILADGPFDNELDAISAELDTEKRAKMNHDFAQKLYDGYYGVMLGWKSATWAMSKKVADWTTVVSLPLENSYEYITAAGR